MDTLPHDPLNQKSDRQEWKSVPDYGLWLLLPRPQFPFGVSSFTCPCGQLLLRGGGGGGGGGQCGAATALMLKMWGQGLVIPLAEPAATKTIAITTMSMHM
jgi:hypothetical protein